MPKRGLALLIVLIMCMGFVSGCTSEDSYTPALEPSRDEPPKQGEETLAKGEFEATLYFVSEDGTRLTAEKRQVRCEEGESMALCTVRELMAGPDNMSLSRSVPSRLKLDKVEKSMSICNVYLSGGFPAQESDWLTVRLAIAATLSDTLDIEAVNVYYNGKEQGYNSHAIGEARYGGESIDFYKSDMEEKYGGRGGSDEAARYISQYVTLYFTNAEKTLIAAHSVELSVSSEATVMDLVTVLTTKLAAGVSGEDALEPVLPADFALARSPEISVIGDDGREDATLSLYAPKVIDLTIKKPGGAYDEQLVSAALTLTITGYLPGISGIRLYVEDENGERTQLFEEEEYLSRDMYSDMLGTSVSVDYPDENASMLRREDKIVPSNEEYDLTARIYTLIEAQRTSGLGFAPLDKEDVERVYLADGVAVIEWKAGSMDKLRDATAAVDDRRELLIIYSFVNTLTEIPYIKKVWMSECGEKLGTVKNIYLGNALLRNPGLIS